MDLAEQFSGVGSKLGCPSCARASRQFRGFALLSGIWLLRCTRFLVLAAEGFLSYGPARVYFINIASVEPATLTRSCNQLLPEACGGGCLVFPTAVVSEAREFGTCCHNRPCLANVP